MADNPTTTPSITGIRTVGVPVRDQTRAVDFYTGVLGLAKTMDVDLAGGTRWIEVAPAAGGTTIALVGATSSAPVPVETGIRLCTPDADEMHAHLLEHGASADEVLRWPGVPPMFTVRDQDGNGLVIVQDA
jgi:catechol 2,3-dioxygenase-like lactoylglutathione lyase family enzyme